MAFDGSIKIDTAIDGNGFSAGLSKLAGTAKSALSGMTTLIAGAAAALGAGATAGVKYNAQMEQYMTSFTTMLGSADKATSMVGDLKKFAADTPFEFSDLAKGTQTLLSFGVSSKDVMGDMKMLGDVSQGNTEKFNSLSLAFGQVSSAGKMSGQDLLQFINAGFNPLNEIAKKTGESMSDLRDRMSAGGISAQEVADAFQSATSEGGLFYNAMDSQSKTFNGQLSTLKDNAMQFLGNITQGFENSLKDTALPMVNGWMTQLSDAFSQGGITGVVSTLGTVLAEAANQIAQQAPGVIDMAVSLIQSFVNGIQQNSAQLATAAVNIVTSLVSGIITLLPQILITGGTLLLQLAQGIANQLPTLIPQALAAIQTLVQGLVDNLPQIINTAIQIIVALVQGIAGALPQLIPSAVEAVLTLVSALLDNIDMLIDAAINLIMALAEGLIDALPILIQKAPEIVEKLFEAIYQNAPRLAAAAFELIAQLWDTLMNTDWLGLGWNLLQGIVEGIWNGITHIDFGAIGNSLLNGVKSVLGIHSPSVLFKNEIGKFIPPGISIGVDKAMPDTISDIKDQMSNMMDKARATISAEQAKVGAAFTASSNYQVALAGGYGNTSEPAAAYTGPSTVETHISINDREFAVAAAPAIGKQLGFEGA